MTLSSTPDDNASRFERYMEAYGAALGQVQKDSPSGPSDAVCSGSGRATGGGGSGTGPCSQVWLCEANDPFTVNRLLVIHLPESRKGRVGCK